MILPKKHHIKQLIVADVHNRCRHAGVNHVLAQVRNRYWVINGRQEVKNWDKECKVCERRRVQPSVQIMALLQRTRVGTTMRACAKCCVDYAGSFTTKITPRVSDKRYLCLFTCSATRAVHLEMAMFIEHHRFPENVQPNGSHQGKTRRSDKWLWDKLCRSGERELRELVQAMDQEQIAGNVANNGLRWNWNPLLGSHFGGVFESLVKVVKKTLKAIVGNAGLTDDELQTAIKEVEALMNSRPLTYEGADPRDEPVLTQ